MAKGKQAAAAPAKEKANSKKINRKRRNALERKCLPKSLKVLFRGSDSTVFRSVLAAWQEGRKKTAAV